MQLCKPRFNVNIIRHFPTKGFKSIHTSFEEILIQWNKYHKNHANVGTYFITIQSSQQNSSGLGLVAGADLIKSCELKVSNQN